MKFTIFIGVFMAMYYFFGLANNITLFNKNLKAKKHRKGRKK